MTSINSGVFMKNALFLSVFASLFVFSSASFAKTTATTFFSTIITSGEYEGRVGQSTEKCFVTVDVKKDSVTVSIKNKNSYDVFAVIDQSFSYSANEEKGEFAATTQLGYPHYLKGGSKQLYVKANDIWEVDFSISTILLDHRGNDASTHLSCVVSAE